MVLSSTNATFGPKVSPDASHFCVDNGRLIDVAEDCLSAEVDLLGRFCRIFGTFGTIWRCTFLIRHDKLNTTDVGW